MTLVNDHPYRADAIRAALLVLLCLLVLPGPAAATDEPISAQPYVWRSWTRVDGLPGGQVWAITQDHAGYIWLGTNEGLVRFDGVRFVSARQLGFEQLPNASVRALFVARDGGLWIGFGTGGIGRLKDGRLQAFTTDAAGLPPGVVAGIVEDRRGVIWAASANGLYRFHGGGWSHVSLASGVTTGVVDAVYADRQGKLWVGTRAGVYRSTDDASTRFERVTTVSAESFAEDRGGDVWSVGAAALTRLTASPPRSVAEAAAYARGQRIIADREGHLWIGTLGGGLLRVNAGRNVVDQVSRPGISSYDLVLAVFQDRERNIWVGTPRGLDRGSRGLIRSLPVRGDGITAPVQAVSAAADGSVWVGTADGLHRFAGGVRGTLVNSERLPGRGVVALHGDAKGRMWVATGRGIGRFDKGRFVAVIPVGTLLNRPVAMAMSRDGTLWLCDLERGLFTWDGRTLVAVPADQYGNRAAFSILADSQGRIWTGHLDGTISVHEAGRSARLYTSADGVLGSVVTGFYEDAAGSIWAGSRNGLMRFRDARIDALAWSGGLPGHTVTAITGDGDGNVWLGVSAGFARFRPEDFDRVITEGVPSLPHTLYDGSDGLRGDPFPLSAPAVARGGDGRLWFLTSDGVAIVSPENHQKNRVAPPVVIEAIAADQRPIVPERDRRLPPRTANLRIDYTALTFVAPEKVRFSYLMEGFDADWIDAGTRREAFYTNLPPRDYRFRVRASNDGVPSDHEAVWAFTLTPAFYQTSWFTAAMVLSALAGAALAWRARVQQVRGRFSAILVERTRVAREIHDTLLQSLLGVMFRLDEVASMGDLSSGSAREQLVRLRHQVEFYVREARYSIRDLRSPILQSRGLPTAIGEIGGSLTGDKAVAFHLEVSGTPRADLQRIDEHLLRIGQEAMTNAVRHANATSITVELSYRPESVAICIRDDGKGFDASRKGTTDGAHWGLRTMRERADQIGGTLRISSDEGRGTVVEVIVPVPADQP